MAMSAPGGGIVVVVLRRNRFRSTLVSSSSLISYNYSSSWPSWCHHNPRRRRSFFTSSSSSSSSTEDEEPITKAYQKFVSNGSIESDKHQLIVSKKLDSLHSILQSTDSKVIHNENLRHYPKKTVLEKCQSYLAKLAVKAFQPQQPKGLYIWGSVGVGKSFLMDLFYDTTILLNGSNGKGSSSSDTTTTNCCHSRRGIRRVHFHEFMIDVHSRIHQYKKRYPPRSGHNAIGIVALSIAKESRILCFDEFQVTDIADAMILKRLFEILIDDYDVVVVATSNRSPSQLYEGGINRDSFTPFIDKLHDTMDVIEMKGSYDYRQQEPENYEEEEKEYVDNDNISISLLDDCYLLSNDPNTHTKLKKIFNTLGGGGHSDIEEEEGEESKTLSVPMGRTIYIPRANKNCAWMDFDYLCKQPLGSADYLTLCQHYPVLIIENIPQLNSSRINEARRFVTLIDALYENKTKLYGSFSFDDDTIITTEDNNNIEKHVFVDFETTIQSNDGDEEIAIHHVDAVNTTKNHDDDNDDDSAAPSSGGKMIVKREGGSSSSSSTTFITTKDGKNEIEWSATGRIGVSLAQLSSVKDVSFSFLRAESRLMEMKRKSWGRLFSFEEKLKLP